VGKPLIALSGRRYAAPEVPSLPANFRDEQVDLHLAAYSDAVAAAGGVAVMLPCIETSVEVLDHVSALVLTGGGDVDPALYGEPRHETVYGVDPHRDRVEIALLRRALEIGLPVLAICRGMQVLNVALGGSLLQHIEGDNVVLHAAWDHPVSARVHTVTFEAGSIAHEVFGDSVEANTLHHQAVGRVAPTLVCTGRAPDGIVESVEIPGRSVWGVQWHPELLAPQPDPAFRWLVERSTAASVAR
jgi:putative glutamine amidotransferase